MVADGPCTLWSTVIHIGVSACHVVARHALLLQPSPSLQSLADVAGGAVTRLQRLVQPPPPGELPHVTAISASNVQLAIFCKEQRDAASCSERRAHPIDYTLCMSFTPPPVCIIINLLFFAVYFIILMQVSPYHHQQLWQYSGPASNCPKVWPTTCPMYV
jgi:hypothetical protein